MLQMAMAHNYLLLRFRDSNYPNWKFKVILFHFFLEFNCFYFSLKIKIKKLKKICLLRCDNGSLNFPNSEPASFMQETENNKNVKDDRENVQNFNCSHCLSHTCLVLAL